MVEKKINSNKFSKNKKIKLFVFTRRILYMYTGTHNRATIREVFLFIFLYFYYMYLGV